MKPKHPVLPKLLYIINTDFCNFCYSMFLTLFDCFKCLLPIVTATDMSEIPVPAPSDLRRKRSLMSPVVLRGFHKDFKDVQLLRLSHSGMQRAGQHQPKHSTDTQKGAETCLDRTILTCRPACFCWEHLAFTTHPPFHWLSSVLEYHLSFHQHAL